MKFELFRRAMMVAGGNSAVSAIDMILGLALVGWLAPEVWNEAAVVLMVFGTCRALGQLGIQEGIYFFYSRLRADERRGLVAQTLLMLTCTASLLALGVLSLEHWLPAVTPAIAEVLPIVALAILLDVPSTCTPQTLIAAERPGWASAYQTGTGVFNTLCVAGPLVLGWGVPALAFGMLLSSAVRLALCLTLAALAVPRGPLRVDMAFLWRQVTFTVPLALSVASSVLNRYIDKWIVSGFEPDKVGAYTFAATELPFITAVGYGMAAVLSTRVTLAFQLERPELARQYWMAACARGALLVGPTTVLVLLVAPELIELFFDPAYAIALAPLQIYNVILFQRVMGYGMMLRSAGRVKLLWFTSVGLLILNTAFSFPLTMWRGIDGAAFGTLLATAIMFLVTLFLFTKIMHASFREVFPWWHYGKILLGCGFAAALAIYFSQSGGPPAWRFAIKAGTYLVVAGAMLTLLRVTKNLPEVPLDTPEVLEKLGAVGTVKVKA